MHPEQCDNVIIQTENDANKKRRRKLKQKLRRLETIVRIHPGFGGGGGLSPINLRVS